MTTPSSRRADWMCFNKVRCFEILEAGVSAPLSGSFPLSRPANFFSSDNSDGYERGKRGIIFIRICRTRVTRW